MKEQTRRNILRYGIAIDLVILATGVGMLVPATAPLLIFVYAAAVALSVWRGGWQGGLTALLLSIAALLGVFPETMTASRFATFAAASVIGGALVIWATRPREAAQPEAEAEAEALPEPVHRPVAVPPLDDFAQQPLERSTLAEVVPLSQEARAETDGAVADPRHETHSPRKRRSNKAERERLERETREAEQRAERERLEAERIAAEAQAERERAEAARIAAEEEAARQREEAERIAAEAQADRERVEAARIAAEEEAARQRAEAERVAAEAQTERERLEREKREAEQRVEAARIAAEEEAARQRAEAERVAAEAQADRERLEREKREAEDRAIAARLAAEEEAARQRADAQAERERLEAERAQLAEERERIEAERRAAEEDLRRQLDQEREAMRADVEQQLAAERERIAKEAEARIAAAPPAPAPPAPAPIAAAAPAPAAAKPAAPAEPKSTLIDTLTGWFRREERSRAVNLKNKRVPTNTVTRRTQAPAAASPRPAASTTGAHAHGPRPRVLLIERRRATADTIATKLKHRGVDIGVVERWVDAVDEIFRFKPHAIFLDIEHPEFERMHRTVSEKSGQLPIVLTGRAGSTPPAVKRAAFVGRPYDVDEVVRVAQTAQSRPEEMLAEQLMPRTVPVKAAPSATMVAVPTLRAPAPVQRVAATPVPAARVEVLPPAKPASENEYEIICFNCRAPFNAIDADWCSCLAKERTLVCTNCLICFCKAPPAYKEKFWVAAPPRLFERKSVEARKQGAALRPNPPQNQVRRPLVLSVEDDEEIQVIVQRVCANLEYGFIWANNGQDGLELAREYRPNLILSDAFMPKLDGREMCRLLKEDPSFAETRMVVMTGLYTDTKYRSEAVKRFHIDDYVAKPVAITDLINILQKHLEGVIGLPIQEDLHELHRQHIDLHEQLDGETPGDAMTADEPMAVDEVALSDMLPETPDMVPVARPRSDTYDVCCFNCQETFDATHAEWCSCVGRDNTLICNHCNGCFCKAPAAYRERFWIDAPPSLFERKMIGSKRNLGARANPAPTDVKRPLILLVEDDENVQLIVRTVVSNMGYGFVVGADGQEGLTLAREYGPDMILSDAFMPKLDGREMCRLLKEDPSTARSKAVIMTGLYTDRKYRNEALDYFKVDDYVAKPLAVDDLIKLFKKHLPQEVTTAH